MINKTFCALPWVHVAVKTSGRFRLCCNQSTLPKDIEIGGYLKGKSATDTPVEVMWNSKSYRELRKRMIKGEPSGPCGRCYREEESGMKSARISNNNDWFDSIGDIDPDGFASLDSIQYVDVRLGNKCNLKCRMCNSYASNRWINDEKLLHLREVPDHDLKMLEKLDWYKSDDFWENLF